MLSKRLGQLISKNRQMSRSFGATVDLGPGELIAGHKQMANIRTDFNRPGLLKKVLRVFNDKNIDLYSLAGKVIEKDAKGLETCEFEVSFDGTKPETIKVVQDQMRALNIDFSIETPRLIPWFPMKESDLDLIGTTLQHAEDGLNQDHPGFMDKAYKARRDAISNNTIGYKMTDPIPRVEYAPEEVELWERIYREVRPLHKELGCIEYNDAIDKLENLGYFSQSKIPQLEDLNQYLRNTTNWRLKPVNGILSQREFLNSLALRTFCSTQYIRHPSKPDYTPEPDIMHELLGHIPNFADPKLCEISQRLGVLSLGATDSQVEQLGAIYWFTIEFGLCKEGNDIKFYGAGPGGSFGEIHNMKKMAESHRDKIYRLDIINNPPPTKFVIQDVQPFYFAADSFDNCLDQLENYSESTFKPFLLKYNEKDNSYEPDRAIMLKAFQPGV